MRASLLAYLALTCAACAHQDVNPTPDGLGKGAATAAEVATAVEGASAPPPTPSVPASGSRAGPVWSNQNKQPADGSLGIAACDDYLALMDRCMGAEVGAREALAQARAAWVQMAQTQDPAVQAALADSCNGAAAALRGNCPGSGPQDPFTDRD